MMAPVKKFPIRWFRFKKLNKWNFNDIVLIMIFKAVNMLSVSEE